MHTQDQSSTGEDFRRLKGQLHEQLVAGLDLNAVGRLPLEELRQELRRAAEQLCQLTPELLNLHERDRLVAEVLNETLGLGPLEPLLADPTISDILINTHQTVYVERAGQLTRADAAFTDERHLLHIIQRIVGQVGRRVDESSPMVDARLADGSRFNAIIPPLALDGALVSIRRFGIRPLRVHDLLAHGSATPEMLAFLESCVKARLNMVISGGTGGGKTTLLNALSAFIPDDERIITIEDAAELRLQQPHVGRLETRPRNIEGRGEVTTRDLVRNSLRMRPDRIIIGECRGPEALDMLQAMNTGHEGSMTTLHANDTRDALGRMEMMVGMAGFEIPIWVIRRQIVSAIHIVVQVSRLLGGGRKIVRISEVIGMEGDNFTMQDVFQFRQTGVDEKRRAQGYFEVVGVRPKCLERLDAWGVGFPPEAFERRRLPALAAGPIRVDAFPRGRAAAEGSRREDEILLIVVLIFLAVTLAILGLYSLVTDLLHQRRPGLRQWVDQELRKRQCERARQSLFLLKYQALPNIPGAPVVPTAWLGARLYGRLEVLIDQAGLFLTPWQVLALAGGLAVFGGAIGTWLAPEAAAPAALAGLTGPFLWMLARRRARKEQMMQQLPRAFELIARVIRAGQSVPQALQAVVDEFDPPLATEFAYCQEQQRLGLLPEISFREMSKRSEVMELKIFVMAMLVQQKTGGNLSDLLDRLARLVRERVRLQGVIRTLTAEGRLQARVLIALPPLMFVLLLVLQRSYVEVLLDHYGLLIAATVSMALGALWIYRIVRLDF